MRYFHNLQKDEKDQILDYELNIYICSGSDSEKLKWFKTINIAGEKLTEQELRNAVYSGSWVADAKRYFSKNNCAAYGLASKYINGSPIRQDYLETAIDWISKGNIEVYMGNHQHDPNAVALWNYFRSVIDWVKAIFPKYRKEMKGVTWGPLYDKFKEVALDAAKKIKDCGIKAIWNFASQEIRLDGVHVENVHLNESLFLLTYKINSEQN